MLIIPAMDTTGGPNWRTRLVDAPQLFDKIRGEVMAEADCHTLGLNWVYEADVGVEMIIILC
jgi:hypothetical protein